LEKPMTKAILAVVLFLALACSGCIPLLFGAALGGGAAAGYAATNHVVHHYSVVKQR
jgi:hypothetical protein